MRGSADIDNRNIMPERRSPFYNNIVGLGATMGRVGGLPLLRHPRAKQERSDVAETLGSMP
jgi:hypothetical protein